MSGIVAFCLALIAGLLLLPGSASLQQKKADQQKDEVPVKVNTELVSFPVTVTDSYNRLVAGLDQRHFEVYEDKVKQQITFFSDEDLPASIGVVFDLSGSMKEKIPRAREALKAFIETSHDEDDFFLVGFNDRARLLAEFSDGKWRWIRVRVKPPRGLPRLNVRAKEGYYAAH